MPELHMRVRWPDGQESLCYSPSSTIREFFTAGESIPLAAFVTRSRAALEHAGERVRAKYGYGCGHAAMQIELIERQAARFRQPGALVRIEGFSSDPAPCRPSS